MKKFIYFILIFILLSFSLSYCISYALEGETENSFITTPLKELSPNSNFDINFNLSNFDMGNYEIRIKSDEIDLKTSKISIISSVNSYFEDNILVITLSNTNNLTVNLETSNNLAINSIVNIRAELYLLNDDATKTLLKKESLNLKLHELNDSNNENKDDDKNNGNNSFPGENSDEDIKNFNGSENNSDFNNVEKSNVTTSNDSNMNTGTSDLKISTSSNNNTTTFTKDQTNNYSGSSNNYLSLLSIDDFSLTNEFNKTNSSYFVNLPADTTSINIKTLPEDFSSNVCIYGNDSLINGTNKILVTVTSENGNIRTYRIYAILQ